MPTCLLHTFSPVRVSEVVVAAPRQERISSVTIMVQVTGVSPYYHGADLSGLQPIQSMLTLPPLHPAVVSHLAAASLLIYLKLKYCETGLCFDSIHDKM